LHELPWDKIESLPSQRYSPDHEVRFQIVLHQVTLMFLPVFAEINFKLTWRTRLKYSKFLKTNYGADSVPAQKLSNAGKRKLQR
jgi:hypothetical protein